ncbi:hypothetical protein Ahy_B06g080692 isoform B [Arachis hypogaea]|uniref:Disease resistance protein n=1 Tax=Arachis hypogaea TaxID=3818 RepID=A0A444YIX9_ARAHY|nr:hypothetical protein Ahy_B06g080692 isoform B [Arachis hypogaea]
MVDQWEPDSLGGNSRTVMIGCECFMKLPPEIGNLEKLEKLDLDETQITHTSAKRGPEVNQYAKLDPLLL